MPIDNYECPLYNTAECDVLSMLDCERCPFRSGKVPDSAAGDIGQFVALLPRGGVAPLFESETCTLCRDHEHAGKKAGYAIIDMAHEHPNTVRKRRMKRRVGFTVPLQFAICKKCRSRLLLLNYLTLLCTVGLTLVMVALLISEKTAEALRAVTTGLPLYLVLIAIVVGFTAGKLITHALMKRWNLEMYVRIAEHPMIDAMKEKGWFFLQDEKKVMPIFTKERMKRGLGRGDSKAYRRILEETGLYEDEDCAEKAEADSSTAFDSEEDEGAMGEAEAAQNLKDSE